MLGLWVRRRFKGGRKQKRVQGILSRILLPIIGFLYKRDGFASSQGEHRAPKVFKEGIMITGLKGTARK